jgi:DNA ligase D-like protein (predicted 3'-phosphoesterase)
VARFVIQLQDRRRCTSTLRLEAGLVLRSWAVPKGSPLDPAVRRLAVPVFDHSLSAGELEGVHGGGSRGSGVLIIWHQGTAEVGPRRARHLSLTLQGHKLAGRFGLTRTARIVMARDDHARPGSDIGAERPQSVRSAGRGGSCETRSSCATA